MKLTKLLIVLFLFSPSMGFSNPCSKEDGLISNFDIFERDNVELKVTFSNDTTQTFPSFYAQNRNPESNKPVYCLVDYFWNYSAFILKESGTEWSKFYWVTLGDGKKTQIGKNTSFSPDKKRIVSHTGDGIASSINVSGVWKVGKGEIEQEYFHEFSDDEPYYMYAEWVDNEIIDIMTWEDQYDPSMKLIRKGKKWEVIKN